MGKIYDSINGKLRDFILSQHVFFVATCPTDLNGHVNVSPKGLDSLLILDEHTVAYADLTGSGVETIAHLKENGRIVVMFCAFEGAPKIVRLHGTGTVLRSGDRGFAELQSRFPSIDGLRSFIRITCERISDSCGFGVPLMEFQGNRSQLTEWAQRKGEHGLVKYQQANNQKSIDGIPAIESSPGHLGESS